MGKKLLTDAERLRTRYIAVPLTNEELRELKVRAARADLVPYRLIRTLLGLEA